MISEKSAEDQLKAKLEWINNSVLCKGSTKTVNTEATMKYRTELTESVTRSYKATKLGCAAFSRLMEMSETRQSGQIETISRFLYSIWDPTPKNSFYFQNLRGLDRAIGDDMLAVIDAIRWGDIPVYTMAENLKQRMPKMLRAWGLIKSNPSTEGN